MNLNPFRKPGRKSKAEKLEEIQEKVDRAKTAVETFHTDWGTWRDYYDGCGQEKIAEPLQELGLEDEFIITNFIFSSLENYVSVLMQAMPQPYVAELGEQTQRARDATTWLQTFKREKNFGAEYEMVLRNAVPIGNGAVKVYWDRDEDDPKIVSVDPESIFPDPAAHNLKEASYVALRNIYSEELAEEIFDGKVFEKIDLEEATKVTSDETGMVEIEDEPEKKGDRVEVWEVYYERGKKLIIYTADQLLFDGDNPTPNGRYPIFIFQLHKQTSKFWSVGLVRYLMGLQDYINKTRTRISIHERYTVAPVWATDSQGTQIDVSPGAINELLPNTTLTGLRPPPLPAEVFQSLDNAKHDFDVIAGTPEVTRGIRPKGTTSGISLEVLQQAAQMRMTGVARNWTYVLRDMWQCVLELMQQYYGEERIMATMLAGEPQAVSIGALSLNQFETETGEEGQEQQVLKPLKMRVVMQAEGELPMSQAAWAEIGLRLKQMPNDEGRAGVIDDQAILDLLKFPGRDELRERRAQQLAAQQAGQQQAMAAQQQAQMQQQAGQQAAQAEQMLASRLPPEYMEILREIAAGRADPGLDQELLASLPEDLRAAAMAYLQAAAAPATI